MYNVSMWNITLFKWFVKLSYFSPAKIDPPIINITQVNGSLLVILHAPSLPYRDQKGKNVSIENYYELLYRVFIINNSLEKVSSGE